MNENEIDRRRSEVTCPISIYDYIFESYRSSVDITKSVNRPIAERYSSFIFVSSDGRYIKKRKKERKEGKKEVVVFKNGAYKTRWFVRNDVRLFGTSLSDFEYQYPGRARRVNVASLRDIHRPGKGNEIF